jgi:hypothetical protein
MGMMELYELTVLQLDVDRVCRGILRVKTVDGYMFAKTCLVYWKTSKMLREVDWDNEHVVMNATW